MRDLFYSADTAIGRDGRFSFWILYLAYFSKPLISPFILDRDFLPYNINMKWFGILVFLFDNGK